MRLVLVDAGFFVQRLGRHWGPRGKLRKIYHLMKSRKRTRKQFNIAVSKELQNDIRYLQFRLRQAGCNPHSSETKVIVCYDGVKAWQNRGILFPEYKANRNKGDKKSISAAEHEGQDLRKQLVSAGLDPMELGKEWEGQYDTKLEADDLIAHEVVKSETYDEVWVLSGDKDLYQLWACRPDLHIHNFQAEIKKDDAWEEIGYIDWEYLPDWKAIVGDSSDNIPGVPGFGASTASFLVKTYGGLESIPSYYFRTYTVLKPELLSEALTTWREEHGLNKTATKERFGYFWGQLEKQKLAEVKGEHFELLRPILPANIIGKWFEEIDYWERAFLYRQLIKLPFVGGCAVSIQEVSSTI